MADKTEPAPTDTPGEVSGRLEGHIEFTNLEAARKFASDGDTIQRFQMQSRLDIYDRLTKHFDAGTALYEKAILLDGAIIALSITFLGSLSSRFTSAHITQALHLWIVSVSWLLLIASMYCSYRTIIERHGAGIRFLTTISSERHQYGHQRLGVALRGIASVIRGEVSHGAENIQISEMFQGLSEGLKAEGEAATKKMDDFILEGKKKYREGVYAHLAIGLTISGVILLCVFTIISVRILF